MKVNDNGVYRDLTPTEIAENERIKSEVGQLPPTDSERLSALESAMLAMMGGMPNV